MSASSFEIEWTVDGAGCRHSPASAGCCLHVMAFTGMSQPCRAGSVEGRGSQGCTCPHWWATESSALASRSGPPSVEAFPRLERGRPDGDTLMLEELGYLMLAVQGQLQVVSDGPQAAPKSTLPLLALLRPRIQAIHSRLYPSCCHAAKERNATTSTWDHHEPGRRSTASLYMISSRCACSLPSVLLVTRPTAP